MIKFFICFFVALILFFPTSALAESNSFVSIVNPIRGGDFWQEKNQDPAVAVEGEMKILKHLNLPATWLIRFDALENQQITNLLKISDDEIGLFLEITPTWTREAGVTYHDKQNWHDGESAFLTGYERPEREKLITSSFEKFKLVFGFYPKSVGAWWIDSYSLGYMQKKYGITVSLIVSDQFTTDNYQIWGQYFGTPYYPSKSNALHPASFIEDKLPVVITQWAARDPVNGYGDGVTQSTFSVQANDYSDYHKLDTKYFASLVDIYTKEQFNQFGHLVVGLENSYSWDKYGKEYENQIKVLSDKQKSGQFQVTTLERFSSWYQNNFPKLSPEHLIMANDPLQTFKKVVWFMNPYYRVGWFINQDGSVFRDIRQYVSGDEEPCFVKRCSSLNFATFATRVLDDVTYGHKWIIDQGKIADFTLNKEADNYIISYKNEAGKLRKIGFLPRDISIDGKIQSIDSAILNTTKDQTETPKQELTLKKGFVKLSFLSVCLKLVKFILFLVFGCIIPGFVIIKNASLKKTFLQRIFLATVIGFVTLTLIFYLFSLLNLRPLIFLYLLISAVLFIRFRLYQFKIDIRKDKFNLLPVVVILAGVIFQVIPTVKNGLIYPFGLGLWGPNTHDGIWHLALINQLIKSVPPENPIFAGTILKNYHFFYDLLIATTNYLSTIPPIDLMFRFYPVIMSLLLGIGTYTLAQNLFKEKLAAVFALYFVYFAGSFGWIVSYIKDRSFAGESAFWANQSISFNLNPPFAISLLVIIALFHMLFSSLKNSKINIFLAIVLTGSLVGFKAYGSVLILSSLLILGILKRRSSYLQIFVGGSIITALIFFANFTITSELFIFAPFWLIHAMIDSPDRVGWTRLSLARQAGIEKNLLKFISAEILSLGLFIVGNLGLRILSLVSFKKIKIIYADNTFLFLLIFSAISFVVPILFIQSGNPWNTIQFSYYGLFVSAVAAGAVLSSIFLKLPKFLSIPVTFAVLIFTPINSVVTATYYTGYLPHAKIDQKELEALDFLSNQKNGIILTFPYDKKIKQKITEPWPLFAYDSTAYVSALSQKTVYLEDEPQNQILFTDYKQRLVASRDFFSSQATGGTFLKDSNIQYIYLPKIYKISLDNNLAGVDVIFDNSEVTVFKVK